MPNRLDGDRKPLNQTGPRRVDFRMLLAIGIVLAAIALAIWRHAG